MKQKYFSYFFTVLISWVSWAGVISGKVTDQNNDPIPGATILVLGTNNGAVSDINGYFSIENIRSGNYTLKISSVGFIEIQRKVSVGNNVVEFNISLEEDLTQLDDVVVEGRLETTEIQAQPISISSINAVELTAQSLSAEELLKQTSGAVVRQFGGLGGDVNINLNGLTGNAVRVYYEGMPLEVFGGGIQINNIPVDALERVDVYKGVMPVEAGTDALGGGINLVPRSRSTDFFRTSYEISSFNTHRVTLDGGKELGRKAFISLQSFANYADNDFVMRDISNRFNRINSNGFSQADTEIIDARRFHDQHRSVSTTLSSKFVELPWADEIGVSLLYNHRFDEIQNGAQLVETAFGEAEREIRNFSQWVNYRKVFFNRISLKYAAVFTQTKDVTDDSTKNVYNWRGDIIESNSISGAEINPGPTARDADNKGIAQRLTLKYDISKKLFLTVSNFNRYNKIEGNDPYSFLFIADEVIDPNTIPSKIGSNIFGVELDYDLFQEKINLKGIYKNYIYDAESIDINVENSPIIPVRKVTENFNGFGFAIKYQIIPSIYLRSSFERAIRIPTEAEIFGNFAGVRPNFSLKPESSDNLNLGIGFNKSIFGFKQFVLSTDVFFRNQEDLIRSVPFGLESTRNVNEAEVDASGFEVTTRIAPLEGLTINGNLTYQESIINTPNINGSALTGVQQPNVPMFFWNAGISYQFKNLFAKDLNVRTFANYFFIDRYSITEVNDLDTANPTNIIPTQKLLNVGIVVSPATEGLDVSFNVKNVTDELVFDNWRVPRPGVNYSFKISYSINQF
ncbi:MAG: TonB-dependent receptor [Bacteroidota bacterium]